VTHVNSDSGACLAVVRLRGSVGMSRELRHVFRLIHLNRKNHATLVENTPERRGMILKVKDYVTWGEVTPETIATLLRRRGMLAGHERLTDQHVRERLGYESMETLAAALHASTADLWKLDGVKPLFRLHPPRKGLRGSIRRPYPEGPLGYRGSAINDLLTRMA
jgi:large subunit ribosomal protein L30